MQNFTSDVWHTDTCWRSCVSSTRCYIVLLRQSLTHQSHMLQIEWQITGVCVLLIRYVFVPRSTVSRLVLFHVHAVRCWTARHSGEKYGLRQADIILASSKGKESLPPGRPLNSTRVVFSCNGCGLASRDDLASAARPITHSTRVVFSCNGCGLACRDDLASAARPITEKVSLRGQTTD